VNNVDILFENTIEPEWINNVDSFINKLLMKLEIDNWEFSVTFCDTNFIRNLNKKYRDKDSVTDVLTFCIDDEPFPFIDNIEMETKGDIIISLCAVKKNADYFNVLLNEELKRVLIHGILHLMGMNHDDNSPDQEMLKFQEEILNELLEEKII